MKKYYLQAMFILATAAYSFTAAAQAESTSTEADSVANINKIRQSVEANPNDLSAHEAFLKASGFSKWGAAENPDFIRQYEDWMKQFPNAATVPYALGHAFASRESPKAKTYLLRAVAIDPKFDKAYFDLWLDAERWGDQKAAEEYLLKAKNANPKSADYAFYYAGLFDGSDFEKYKKLSLQVAKDFPKTERGAQALYWLGSRTNDRKAKIPFYEQLKADFPPDQYNWSTSGMSSYFDLLLEDDPQQALALAQYMLDLKSKDERSAKTWQANIDLAKNITETQVLLKAGKATDALALSEKLVMPRYTSAKEYLQLFKSSVLDAAGKTDEAYKNLLFAFVKEPTAKLNAQLTSYGNKMGKNKQAVEKDVWHTRDTAARQAPNFSLENYYTKAPSSLSDYKGKVVLLTYWFPGCGPCRGEFPHFENVIKKFKGKDFVYLGINIVEDQDEYVLPFMKSTGYTFIPLRDTKEWKKGPLDNRNAAPVNFLIDGNGKIIFANFRTDGNNETTLEMMIASMLERKQDA